MSSCTECQDLSRYQPPSPSVRVFKEECTQCFDSQDDENGLNVCLACFNGGCPSHSKHHGTSNHHNVVLNIKRTEKPGSTEPPAKITKVAIGVDGGAESKHQEFDFAYSVHCLACSRQIPLEGSIASVTQGVKDATSAAQQDDIKSWELQLEPCVHTTGLQQVDNPPQHGSEAMKCGKCDLKENLWLCLTCGNVGCGRSNWDGTGGNGHGLEHGDQSGHHVVVKMGTITPEGTADIYCYGCNDERTDPDLAKHLKHFNIDVQSQERTEKTMAELNLDLNLKYDWAMVSEDGVPLKPVTGPGLTGLVNFGNSCYLASAIQVLFTLPAFKAKYYSPDNAHTLSCQRSSPAECYRCQFEKMANGILSGRWSRLKDSGDPESGQVGITPRMFKNFTAGDHPEFSSLRQQDTHEYLQHLKQVISREEHSLNNGNDDPVKSFKFQLEERYQCNECQGVRLVKVEEEDLKLRIPVPAELLSNPTMQHDASTFPAASLEGLLGNFLAPEVIPDYPCTKCNKKVHVTKTIFVDTFPETLCVQVGRFFPDHNYVVRKLLIKATVPDTVQFETISAPGLGPDDIELPETGAGTAASAPVPVANPALLEQLLDMGIPHVRAEKGLLATGNNNVEAAMDWVFSHSDDPDIDVPTPAASASGAAPAVVAAAPTALVEQLTAMGFTDKQAAKALRETSNNVERAVDWLFSHPDDTGEDEIPTPAAAGNPGTVSAGGSKPCSGRPGPAKYKLVGYISHKGTSVHCGHYVAHVLKEEGWTLFNDNKVALRADDATQHQGYVYFFVREE